MRFMVLVKANADSEAGVMPSEELLTEMGKFNEELVKAGVMLAGEGLQPSSKGARVQFSGDKRTVIDGPFTETKELIAGFWIIQAKSLEEAIEWIKKVPNPTGERVRSRSARCSRKTTSATNTRPRRASGPSAPSRRSSHVSSRQDAPRHRRGLADRVRPADRGPRADRRATSESRKSWRRTRSSPRSSSGRSQASRTTRAPGSWPPPSTGPSTSCAGKERLERKQEELGRDLEHGGADAGPRRGARRRRRRRPAAARLHRLPPGAVDRGAGGAHAAAAGRADDRRDRARVPRLRSRPSRSGSCAPSGRWPRSTRAVRGAARDRAGRAARVGARSHLPDLQRGLFGDGRRRLDAAGAVRGRAAAGPHPRRARARRSPRCTAWSR